MSNIPQPEPLPLGDGLYHYTRMETALAFILPQGTLRFSRLSDVRDQLETRKRWPGFVYLDPHMLEEEVERSAQGTAPDMDEESLREARDFHRFQISKGMSAHRTGEDMWISGFAPIIDLCVVACLTRDREEVHNPEERPFAYGFARASLWQNYADDHQGVCLAFDRAELLKETEAQLGSTSGATYAAQRVRYVPVPPTVPIGIQELRDADSPEAFWEEYGETIRDDFLFTKLIDWSNEEEFRIVSVLPGLDIRL